MSYLFNGMVIEQLVKTLKMANCNKLFHDYNGNLTISKTKNDKLKDSKEKVRDAIRNHFKDNHPDYNPEFFIQGSYKMKTTIVTKDDECDVDDGVYFKREVGVSGTTLQQWIKDAVADVTTTTPEHRKKCVRVIYKADYHIDLPAYYFPEDWSHPQLAVKNEDLQECDPKDVVDWFKNEKDNNGQLVRIVKYLKGWGDYKRNKMPSGLAMCILAAINIQYNDRDDVAIKDTLAKIQESLENSFECIVPATPYDDLFESYDEARKNNFLSNLDDFVKDSEKAVNDEPNQNRASKIWRKYFGDKFPLGKDEDTDAKEAQLKSVSNKILSGTAYADSDGKINSSEGVKHKPHTNYGQ
ncbi:CBASS cGAMP synthase [Psychroserpens sp. SPM9]|uniref:CBASS cGAMP synthase n=1 Tax=Psychroserpens sp. SPM9 TaxID=2975598 RepID=UPI0021A7C114|nr:CBASS cGAMP synthase [Psychroserpens sp. SPM9]MDG5490592.1 CBASS cGAMP synthase [Psychroserpens sp. SPM9]